MTYFHWGYLIITAIDASQTSPHTICSPLMLVWCVFSDNQQAGSHLRHIIWDHLLCFFSTCREAWVNEHYTCHLQSASASLGPIVMKSFRNKQVFIHLRQDFGVLPDAGSKAHCDNVKCKASPPPYIAKWETWQCLRFVQTCVTSPENDPRPSLR